MTKPETEKLPPMPKEAARYMRGCNWDIPEGELLFTADQMRAYALAAIRAKGGGATPIAYGVGLGSGKGGGFVYVDSTYEQARLSACHCADKTIWPLYTRPAPAPDEPLKVFSAGTWTYKETGQSFAASELDEAAFVAYRDAHAPEVVALIVRDCCESETSDPARDDTIMIREGTLREILERHLAHARSAGGEGNE